MPGLAPEKGFGAPGAMQRTPRRVKVSGLVAEFPGRHRLSQ